MSSAGRKGNQRDRELVQYVDDFSRIRRGKRTKLEPLQCRQGTRSLFDNRRAPYCIWLG